MIPLRLDRFSPALTSGVVVRDTTLDLRRRLRSVDDASFFDAVSVDSDGSSDVELDTRLGRLPGC